MRKLSKMHLRVMSRKPDRHLSHAEQRAASLAMEKGWRYGPCNFTACQKVPATHYNQSTRKWYCVHCAHMLNHYNNADSWVRALPIPTLCLDAQEYETWCKLKEAP